MRSVSDEERLVALRDEIVRLLAAALQTDQRHEAEMQRRDQLHVAESDRRDTLHVQELQRRDDLHARELEMIREALETRDIIGQAKGVIMAALSCSPDEAFNLLRQQSQHENRKLVDVAIDIVKRACEEPLRAISNNAGWEGAIVIGKVRDSKDKNYGFNAATGDYEDLLKSGVIDPAKVTRYALQNASSISALMLTTEAMICEIPEKKPAAPAGPGGHGPDMDY